MTTVSIVALFILGQAPVVADAPTDGKLLHLLLQRPVAADLKLTPNQSADIRALSERRFASVKQIGKGYSDLPKEGREAIEEAMLAAQDRFDRELDNLLSPTQLKRLKQIHAQQQSRQYRFSGFVLSPIAENRLQLTDSQRDLIREDAEKLAESYKKEVELLMARLRALDSATMENALKRLSDKQRQDHFDLFGAPFNSGNPGEFLSIP